MTKNFGIDLGNGFTKYDGGVFASAVELGTLTGVDGTVGENIHDVQIGSDSYTVGKGSQFISNERFKETNYHICLLTAIALASKSKPTKKKVVEIEANVVLGLPVGIYKGYKDEMAEYLMGILGGQANILTVDKIVYSITIKGIKIFIEGALPLVKGMKEHTVVMDIGAGTINFQSWNKGSLVEKATIKQGYTHLITSLATKINEKIKAEYDSVLIYDVLETGIARNSKGEENVQDVIDTFFNAQVGDILSKFQTSLGMSMAKDILVFGGGATPLMKYIKDKYPKAQLVEGNQFVNQKIYTALAKEMFK